MRRKELRKDRNLVGDKFKTSKTRFISFQEKKKKQLQTESQGSSGLVNKLMCRASSPKLNAISLKLPHPGFQVKLRV